MLKKSLLLSVALAGILNAGMFGDIAGSLMGDKDNTGTELHAIFDTMDESAKKLDTSVNTINSSLADSKQIAKWNDQSKVIEKLTDDEKAPAIAKLNKDKMVYATALSTNKDALAKAKKLPSGQKETLGIAISDILLVSTKEKEAAGKAKELVKSIMASPKSAAIYAGDLPKLKDVITNTPAMIQDQTALSKGMVTLANGANITIQQPKPKPEIN